MWVWIIALACLYLAGGLLVLAICSAAKRGTSVMPGVAPAPGHGYPAGTHPTTDREITTPDPLSVTADEDGATLTTERTTSGKSSATVRDSKTAGDVPADEPHEKFVR